jgi:PleD family two-component response regulator
MPIDIDTDKTVSAGVARAIPALDEEAAIDAADQALYRAKVAGRNRVELAD